MNNYTNPISLIKEEFLEATTIAEKSLIIFIAAWAAMLAFLVVGGVSILFYEIITNPSTFNSVTFGVFDTLG